MTGAAYRLDKHTDPLAWQDRALCRGLADLFDPPDPTPETEEWAKDICRTCPVLMACHQWVMSLPTVYDPGGVTAQRTEDERRHLRHSEGVKRWRRKAAS